MSAQNWPKFIRKWASWLNQDGRTIRPRFQPTALLLEERALLSFGGWVAVAGGDVNSDGFADIVTGAGIGGGPHVRVLNGQDGTELHSFFAYSSDFTGGVYVGVGDVNGDGVGDIVTGAGPGGGPHVRVFDGRTGSDVGSFFASSPTSRAGVSIAVSDINKDGLADIITGSGSQVRVFSGKDQSELISFTAYSSDFTGSVYVAAGDVTGDGFPDIVTGAGEGGGPHVRVFNGQTGQLTSEWFAYDSETRDGVRVAVSNVIGDERNEVITTPGFGGGPHIRVFDAIEQNAVVELMAFSESFRGGIHVATADLDADGRGDFIVAEGIGGQAEVRVFSSKTLAENMRFIAYDPAQSPGRFSVFAASPGVIPLVPPLTPPGVTQVVPPIAPPTVAPTVPPTLKPVSPPAAPPVVVPVTPPIVPPVVIPVTPPIVPPSRTVVSTADFAGATDFLYMGANPVQTGVAASTINPMRAAVIRGKVVDRAKQPLVGAVVSILDHPEFGQTTTQADGWFSLAVNGGGLLTLNYAKLGFLPSQRQVNVPWRDYEIADEVALVPLDERVTTIDLTSVSTPIQVAQGNMVTDEDGTRQATVLFPQGVTATMKLPNGTTQPLTTLNVRATEYTVGESGPAAMPGTLPPASGYTYAVELSVDEAIAAGATEVTFSQPVPFYVQNFLNFPVGMAVPAGYYDRQRGLWIASDNGRVIKVLSESNGSAAIDIDGDGNADTGAALTGLGVTSAELVEIARFYEPGDGLWRVPIPHFTPWDCNWPYGPPPGAKASDVKPEEIQSPNVDDPAKACGSVIGVENQTLSEVIPIVGTQFSLVYNSDRVPGSTPGRTLRFPLTRATPPPNLNRVELSVKVGGRVFSQQFPATPNLMTEFTWDGFDGFGRELIGAAAASVEIGYVYDAVYQRPAENAQAFGLLSGTPIRGNRARNELTLLQYLSFELGVQNDKTTGIVGWTLDNLHSYDTVSRTVHLGYGGTLHADDMTQAVLRHVAGGATSGFSADGTIATNAQLSPIAVAFDSLGRLLFLEGNRLRAVVAGRLVTLAGNAESGDRGDGGPASDAQLNSPTDLVVGPDDSIYVADYGNARIRRILPDGTITTHSAIPGVRLAAGRDGTIYASGDDNSSVLQISPNGRVSTLLRRRSPNEGSGDGRPTSEGRLRYVGGLAVAPDGSVLVMDSYQSPDEIVDIFYLDGRIRRVSPDGVITTIAGRSSGSAGGGYEGDGGPALNAYFNALSGGLMIDRSGAIFLTDLQYGLIRKVDPSGVISRYAGNGSVTPFWRELPSRSNSSPTSVELRSVSEMALDPDENLYFVEEGRRIWGIVSSLSGYAVDDIIIPSEDGAQIFRFSSAGRHLQTFDALTGTPIYTFGYDSAGRLISITDADNEVTSIERNANGTATAIVGPFGHRTTLTTNSDGYLTKVTNPGGKSHIMDYGTGGLLTSFTDPLGHTSTMDYDSLGRLIKDEDPANGYTELSRENLGGGSYRVTTTNAVGGTRSYGVEFLPDGNTRRTSVDGRGFVTTTLIGTDGTRTVTTPDGTVTTTVYGPDPRFGMLSPVVTSQTVRLPSGLTSTTTGSRTATFAIANDTSSPLRTLTDTVTVNGKTFSSVYDATARTVTTTSAEGRTTVTTSDEKGRIIKAEVPGLLPTTYAYDSRGRMIAVTQGTRSVTYAYDPQGNLMSITDPLGRATKLEYDAVGRITKQTQPDDSIITFRYDDEGKMVGLTPPGQPEHSFDYNSRDLLISSTAPDIGPGDETTRYVYNLAKQLVQENLPGGSTIQYAYCDCGRLTSITSAWGNYTYTYSDTTGQLTSLAGPNGFTLSTGYDGILATSEITTGPVAGRTNWTYDNNFRVVSESVNGANPVTFAYDNDGLLTRAGSLTISRDTSNGRMTGTILGTVTDTVSYDQYGDRSGYQARIGSNTALEYTQTRDALGRITQKVESKNGITTTTVYGYDLNGQLETVTENGVLIQTYVYDVNGNRLSLTTPSGTLAGSYDDQDRLITYGTKNYTYTVDGYLSAVTDSTTGQTTRYTYDGFGNLTRVQLPDGRDITYQIDPDNRRVGKQINGEQTQGLLYNGQLTPIAELDTNGNVITRFVYSTGINVPAYMIRGGVTYRLVTDDLGSVRVVVNITTGEIAQRLDYDAFGRVITDTNPGFQPFGYAGGLYDADTGLVRFGARDYDAVTGRWTASDPLSFAADATNLYQYVANNPVVYIDPEGRETKAPDAGWLNPIKMLLEKLGGEIADEYGFTPEHIKNPPNTSNELPPMHLLTTPYHRLIRRLDAERKQAEKQKYFGELNDRLLDMGGKSRLSDLDRLMRRLNPTKQGTANRDCDN
jgi:RHS repeat-associated protein